MKKTITILLTVLMLVSIIGGAVADGVSALNDDAVVANNKAIRFEKEITVYNPDNATVNEPTATYKYTVTAGSAAKTVKDTNGKQAATKAGVLTNLKISSQTSPTASNTNQITLTYAPNSGTTMAASQNGTKNSKWVEIDFSDVVFGAAGIYRYVITESDYSYTSNGVVAGTTGHVRYLDVYVKDAETQSASADEADDWDVYGYAMFTADDSIDASVVSGETKKTTGFVTHFDGPDDIGNKKTADAYYTFNLTLQKTVVSDSYIKSTHHQFPFTVTLSNTTVTAKVLPIMTVSTNASQTALDSTGIVISSSTVWSPTIADSASVSYVGIPAGTAITICETNDVTGATYVVSSSGADTELSANAVYSGNTSGNATVSIGATAGTAVSTNKTVVFSNNLDEISPTGYVSRFAPYALILVGGIILLIIAKKRKPAKDDEE